MKNVKGFTLVEVLVSVLILSTALLGLVGLQTAGMRNIIGSYNRTQASHLASNMADRIRANTADITATTTGGTSLYTSKGANPSTATAKANCFTSTGCSAAEMAENDLYQWYYSQLTNTDNGLIKTGTVTTVDNCSAASPSPTIQVTVTVGWNEGRDDNKDGIIDPDLAFRTVFQVPRNPC